MKFYILIFLVISSCTILNGDRAQKIYICGDHVCSSKKERNEYFKNNISLEVYSISPSDKKDRDFDLVELNMSKDQKEEIFSTANQKKSINENLKKRKKLTKTRIKEGEKVNTKSKNIKSLKKPKITLIRICKDLDECDINDVAKIIFNKANEKKFPNLTFK